jgi:membrane-associated phospholipid phosphatase
MIGAHWFTDIAVGSLSVALIALPWCLMTPLSDWIIKLFDRYLPGRCNKFKTIINLNSGYPSGIIFDP